MAHTATIAELTGRNIAVGYELDRYPVNPALTAFWHRQADLLVVTDSRKEPPLTSNPAAGFSVNLSAASLCSHS
jgi:hypothetical protein